MTSVNSCISANHDLFNDILKQIQWNLSISDMLYSGHLTIADTLFKNQFTLDMVKPLHFEPLYSRHLSIADTFP